jgi:hypothetical protein
VDVKVSWLRRPGIVSVFRTNDGTAHEYSTPLDEINIWMGTSMGSMTHLSTSRS